MSLKRHSRHRGFTLVELLIAMALLILFLVLALNFFNQFNHLSQDTILEQEMDIELRSALNRLDRELTGAAEILPHQPGNPALPTDSNRVFFTVPIYSPHGFIVVDDAGRPVQDTLMLEAIDDPEPQARLVLRTPPVQSQKLVLSVMPSINSSRKPVVQQALIGGLMPKHSTTLAYDCLPIYRQCPLATAPAATGTFTLIKRDGVVTTSEFAEVTQVRILLRSEREYGRQRLSKAKAFTLRLRNWQPAASPSP